jgi:hypothetical protein
VVLSSIKGPLGTAFKTLPKYWKTSPAQCFGDQAVSYPKAHLVFAWTAQLHLVSYALRALLCKGFVLQSNAKLCVTGSNRIDEVIKSPSRQPLSHRAGRARIALAGIMIENALPPMNWQNAAAPPDARRRQKLTQLRPFHRCSASTPKMMAKQSSWISWMRRVVSTSI